MTERGVAARCEPLFEAIASSIQIETLSSSTCSVYVARLQLIVSLQSFENEELSVAVDAAGVALTEDEARTKCSYETLERLFGTAPAAIHAHTYLQPSQRATVVDWQSFTPYGEAELRRLERAMSNGSARWCQARGMLTDRPYQVPASKVFPAWPRYVPADAFDGECDSSGLAAAASADVARCRQHGLCEILERDAMMLAWRLPHWLVHAMPDLQVVVPDLAAFLDEHAVTGMLFEIGEPGLAPVVLCLLTNRAGGVTCGSACNLDIDAASRHSVLEAIMLWNAMRKPGSDDVGSGSRIDTSYDHVRYGWRNGATVASWFAALPRREPTRPPANFEELVRRCWNRFFDSEPLVVDLTLPGLSGHVCRVLQPHACRKEWNSANPFVGGRRFQMLAAGCQQINRLPHPYG